MHQDYRILPANLGLVVLIRVFALILSLILISPLIGSLWYLHLIEWRWTSSLISSTERSFAMVYSDKIEQIFGHSRAQTFCSTWIQYGENNILYYYQNIFVIVIVTVTVIVTAIKSCFVFLPVVLVPILTFFSLLMG